jgi:hypothetical protein
MALTKVRGSGIDADGQEVIFDADADTSITADTDDRIDIKVAGTDKVFVTSTGLAINQQTPAAVLHVEGNTNDYAGSPTIYFGSTSTANSAVRDWAIGSVDKNYGDFAIFQGASTGANAIADGNQKVTFDASGRVLIGNTSYDSTSTGVLLNGASGKGFFTVSGDAPLLVNRLSSDGDMVEIKQANNTEGTISVSGSTVSYNGFSGLHESSGIATNTPIGTVVSTIDELDTYSAKQNGMDGEEEDSPKAGKTRADHAKVEISSTVGDKAVYGVVATFNKQGKVNVASVGISSVRVTGACAKGDLLESNGDGTAKVQSDDIVRSKTIGKVTIGNSSTDAKLVSCVLYCG